MKVADEEITVTLQPAKPTCCSRFKHDTNITKWLMERIDRHFPVRRNRSVGGLECRVKVETSICFPPHSADDDADFELREGEDTRKTGEMAFKSCLTFPSAGLYSSSCPTAGFFAASF
ncbi:hypothetical protein BC830DRAFT_1132831 [Chytriomyces sp. MP71]|nr:hypothetical protein BC830DRAFT_1132831 [Chytriomyces sp. MP71]